MADFEGEDVLSEEELAHINAHAHFVAAAQLVRDTGHHNMQHHLANMASSYDQLEKGGFSDTGHHNMQHHLANMTSSYDQLEKGACKGYATRQRFTQRYHQRL